MTDAADGADGKGETSGRAAAARSVAPDALVALCVGAGGVAGSYAATGATPAFVVAPVAAALSRAMPGPVVAFAITVLGDLGQTLNLAAATALTAAALGAAAYGARAAADRTGWPGLAVPVLAGAGVGAVALALTGAVRSAASAGVAAALVAGLARVAATERDAVGGAPEPAGGPRRRVLAAVGGLVGAGAVGTLLGDGRADAAEGEPVATVTEAEAEREAAMLAEAREKSLGVERIDSLVSDIFYVVDINSVDPEVAPGDWSLTVTGAVEEELELDYGALTGRESRSVFQTLRCVGDPLNGDKMDNAVWTVADVAPLLSEAGAAEECCVMVRAADGYYQEFPREALERASLAYRRNGRPLGRSHGAPVRLLVPGHWGEINVKWIEEIEVLTEPATGYWEKRGWHGTGPVNTVAKLHAVNRRDDGRIQVAGHAYAGTRGVERVEVSTDGGATWTDAELSAPLPGDDVWRQWRHVYDPPEGEHEVVVRAVDGTGAVQPRERSAAYPSGATGWVSRTVER